MDDTWDESRLTPDDVLDLQQVGDAQLHPDGQRIAYTVVSVVTEAKESKADSRIWLTTVGGVEPRSLTAEGTRAASPRWSPDGATLAFLGSREGEGKDQLFLLNEWGEARQATDCPGGVTGLHWLPDGSGLMLLVIDAPPEDEEDEHEAGRDWVVYEHDYCFTRIWQYDLASQALTQVSHADAQIYELAVSPDGREIVALVADEPYNWSWYRARLSRLRQDGTFETIHRSTKQYTSPAFSPDGQRLAVITCTFSDQGMTGGDVLLLDRDGGNPRLLTEGHPRSYLNAVWDADGTRLLCGAIEDGETLLGWLGLDGAFDAFHQEQSTIHYSSTIFSRSADGNRLVISRSTPTAATDVYSLGRDGSSLSRHSDHNPWVRERRIAPVETLHWRAPDGMTIQGLLVRPVDAGSGPLPMVTLIHGGPTSLWSYNFPAVRSTGWVQLLVAEGYAVFLPNPRGSMGWGTAFAEANVGDMGGADWGDIVAGVDHCIAEGIADPDRLGVGGWSYGGYLTAWAVTQTTRFKAAVAGASITNWISFHGVSTIPDFDANFYAVDPFNWDGHYGQFSPMAHVRNVTTPTLFLHGERDPICPLGQAHEMWRALKELGVDTQLTVYPREGHGIREREHARDVLERAIGWWKAYL
ncbi:MAG TPA: S9 family peptidase [Thermomicrobiales bacterium]|nr:S9 family peptidase [Thermomicrobiales bacterium]